MDTTSAAKATKYNCTFPAMIAAWRNAWSVGTAGQTDPQFAFGFVQLSVWGDPHDPPTPGEYVAQVRWGQTADKGFVPNERLPNVFMATAVDLGAFMGGCGHDTFPSLCIHPGFKQEVGRRLSLGAADLVLNDKSVYWTGPIFESAQTTGPIGARDLVVDFSASSVPGGKLELRNTTGFEISKGTSAAPAWLKVPIISSSGTRVTLGLPHTGDWHDATLVRYLWSQNPCSHPHYEPGNCSIYAGGLPATPFIHEFN